VYRILRDVAVKRCPLCHRVNDPQDWQCTQCGYRFGQSVEKSLVIVESQLHNAYLLFGISIVGVVGLLAVMFFLGLVWFAGVVLAMVGAARSARTIGISRHSMRALKRQQLPKARVVSGGEAKSE
jgi:RNA polymerase subunit RPABC4/transcription elongation factor Spt4